MYLRHTTVRRGGKTHTYWRLVRSVRVGRKVRQETVAQLGELDAKGQLAARSLAERLVGIERSPGLFDDNSPTEPIALDLRGLRLERGRVQWSRNEATWTQARACDGCYVLRSNVTDWGSEELCVCTFNSPKRKRRSGFTRSP